MITMKESILWKDFEKQEKSLKLEFFPTVLAFKMFEEEAKKKVVTGTARSTGERWVKTK